jgi:hypothetical protein
VVGVVLPETVAGDLIPAYFFPAGMTGYVSTLYLIMRIADNQGRMSTKQSGNDTPPPKRDWHNWKLIQNDS